DRQRRKTLIIGGLIFWSAITVATAVSTNYAQLVIFRALEGFGEAFYFPASMSMLSDYHGTDTRSRAMAIHQSSVNAGTIAGGSMGGLMGQCYAWRSGFYLFGTLGGLLGLLLLMLLREPKPGVTTRASAKEQHWEDNMGVIATTRELLGNPMALILIAVFVGANFVAVIFLTWMPSFLFRKFN